MDNIRNRQGLTKEEAEAFIGNNAYFYMEEWREHGGKTLKGWNWAAFFLGIEWMAYRKMYVEAVLTFLAVSVTSIALNLLLGLLGLPWGLGKALGDLFRLVLGILGNLLYRNKALRSVRKTGALDEPSRLSYLKSKGGTSAIGVVGCVAIEVIMLLLL